jgi:hypothetical protein
MVILSSIATTHRKCTLMTHLIAWPALGEETGWRDSGEGGLFVYAVWPLPATECHVDAMPLLGHGDVLVGAAGPLRTAFLPYYSPEAGGCIRVRPVFGYDEEEDAEDLSTSLRLAVTGTVVFLGSTGSSYFHDGGGDYFTATGSTLTEAGAAFVASLTALFGEPTFVTYLDT